MRSSGTRGGVALAALLVAGATAWKGSANTDVRHRVPVTARNARASPNLSPDVRHRPEVRHRVPGLVAGATAWKGSANTDVRHRVPVTARNARASPNLSPDVRHRDVAAAASGWRAAAPDHAWSFPRDHHAHPGYRNEWWYFTGIVAPPGAPARRIGYQLTFFRVGLVPRAPPFGSEWAAADAVMVHAAVTDVERGTHRFSETLWRAMPLLGGFPPAPDPVLAWALAPAGTAGRSEVRLEGGAFHVSLRDDAQAIALDLVLRPEKPVALQGPGGYSRKAAQEGYASLYYSVTRLATSGTLERDGAAIAVAGESWMDKEVGSSQLAPDQVGWDWWSLRLADGRDLMLYVLRGKDGSASWRNGTVVDAAGRVRVLAPGEWSARALGTWHSDASGATYPSGWEVTLAGEAPLTVVPEVRGAENVSAALPGLAYWEGPVRVVREGGEAAGEGYVELTGYTRGARLPL